LRKEGKERKGRKKGRKGVKEGGRKEDLISGIIKENHYIHPISRSTAINIV
jgi:hypothetical protein